MSKKDQRRYDLGRKWVPVKVPTIQCFGVWGNGICKFNDRRESHSVLATYGWVGLADVIPASYDMLVSGFFAVAILIWS